MYFEFNLIVRQVYSYQDTWLWKANLTLHVGLSLPKLTDVAHFLTFQHLVDLTVHPITVTYKVRIIYFKSTFTTFRSNQFVTLSDPTHWPTSKVFYTSI